MPPQTDIDQEFHLEQELRLQEHLLTATTVTALEVTATVRVEAVVIEVVVTVLAEVAALEVVATAREEVVAQEVLEATEALEAAQEVLEAVLEVQVAVLGLAEDRLLGVEVVADVNN